MALCIADSDDLETPFVSTAPFGYLRLRSTRYDAAALELWAQKIRARNWQDGFVFFKHEDEGTGPMFGEMMQKFLAS